MPLIYIEKMEGRFLDLVLREAVSDGSARANAGADGDFSSFLLSMGFLVEVAASMTYHGLLRRE